MTSDGSVTRLLDGLNIGNPDAVQELWERYFRRLVGLARKRLEGTARRVTDEEDVALSAFKSFCLNAEQGKFPELLDRDGLWRLLVTITVRKAAKTLRDEGCRKRGGDVGQVTETTGAEDAPPPIEELLSREPSPEEVTAAAEEYDRLLGLLGDEQLKQVAVRRMEGYSVQQIAEQTGYVARSVKRKLSLIRELWEREIEP